MNPPFHVKPKKLDSQGQRNFLRQLSRAKRLVRYAGLLGFLSLRVLGQKSKRFPLVGITAKAASTLMAVQSQTPLPSRPAEIPDLSLCKFQEPIELIDLVVAGSGPGAGVAVRAALNREESVLVVEKGWLPSETVNSHSSAQMFLDFANGGQDVILSNPVIPYAQGEVWGGGSEVNSGLFHEIPQSILSSWARSASLDAEILRASGKKIRDELMVSHQDTDALGIYTKSPLQRIGKGWGWEGGIIPRWRTYREESFEHHGISNTHLNNLPSQSSVLGHSFWSFQVLDGVVVSIIKGAGCRHKLYSKKLCLAAGTIETPAILLRSKVANIRDFKFQFHAMIREVAQFSERVNDLSDIDPHQYWSEDGHEKIGAAVGTPELLRGTLESKGADLPSALENVASYYISLPSEGKGGLLRLFSDIYPYFLPRKSFRQKCLNAQGRLRSAIADLGGSLLGDGSLSISTVHVFGSIPIGNTKLIDNRGYLKSFPNAVYVRDASILPSHPLVNPQGPLMQLIDALEVSKEVSSEVSSNE